MIEVAGDLNDRILSRISPENQQITEETLAIVKETMKEILLEMASSETDGDPKSPYPVREQLPS
jgi:hypothetical protein